MTAAKVTLVPTGTAFIPGVPAVEQAVSPKRASELLAYSPPAFTVKKPPKARLEAKAATKPAGKAASQPAPIKETTNSAPVAGGEK